MSSAVFRVTLFGCLLLGLQPLVGKIPLIGWFLTIWPVTWGLWIYLASRVARETRPYLQGSDQPRIPVMAWSALVGAISGLAGAVAGLVVDAVVALLFVAAGPAGTGGAVLAGLDASLSVFALVTRPFFGIFVCGLAGLLLGGVPNARRIPQ